jgi:hypothetical protein
MSRIRPLLVAALLFTGLTAAPASAAYAPTCSQHIYGTYREDKPVTLDFGCDDLDGSEVIVTVAVAPGHGSLGEITSGAHGEDDRYQVTYDPDPGYIGSDSFTLEASDGVESVQLVFDLELTANRAPFCDSDWAVHTPVGVPREDVRECTDVDWQDYDDLEFSVSSGPTHGEASVTHGGLGLNGEKWESTYTPDPGFVGADEFTITASDGDLSTAVVMRVHVADTPWCTPLEEPISVRAGKAAQIGFDCTHPSGSDLRARVIDAPALGSATPGAGYPSVTYSSDAAAAGIDTFSYQAYSSHGDSPVVTQEVTVLPNAAPVCDPRTRRTPVGSTPSFVLRCTDAEDDPVTLALARQPDHGQLGEIVDGQVTYTPDAGFVGTDRFSYAGADYARTSAPAVVRITVDDGKAPVLDLSIARGQTPRGVARQGLAYYSDNDEQITGEIVATISGRTAKRLGLVRRASGPVRIAVDRSRYEHDTSVLGLLHLTDRAAEAIRPARRVAITVRFRGVDPLGNATTVRVQRTLRR